MSGVVGLQHASVPMPAGGNDQAREFYGSKLGLQEKVVPDTLDGEKLVWFQLGDNGDELHVFTEGGASPSPGQHICIHVDSLDSWRASLTSNGIQIEETEAIVNRPRFFIHDPFGNRLEIAQILGDYRSEPVERASQ